MLNRLKTAYNSNLIYGRWWSWGWFVFYLGLTIWYAFAFTGALQIGLVALMAFLTGFQYEFATAVCGWKRISEGWEELYRRSNAWRNN